MYSPLGNWYRPNLEILTLAKKSGMYSCTGYLLTNNFNLFKHFKTRIYSTKKSDRRVYLRVAGFAASSCIASFFELALNWDLSLLLSEVKIPF